MKEIIILFFSVVLQNASFTLVSRARNSKSLTYHIIAATLSNGLWLLVIRQVVVNLNSVSMNITYLIGAVVGSVLMHWIAMTHFETNSTLLLSYISDYFTGRKWKEDKDKAVRSIDVNGHIIQVGQPYLFKWKPWSSSSSIVELSVVEISDKAIKLKFATSQTPFWIHKETFISDYSLVERLSSEF